MRHFIVTDQGKKIPEQGLQKHRKPRDVLIFQKEDHGTLLLFWEKITIKIEEYETKDIIGFRLYF